MLTSPQHRHHRWGLADFFDGRRKALLVKIANMKPSDVMYDLGSGDASLLIYVMERCGLRKAIGFENMQSRARRARLRIREAGLEARIFIEKDMYDADLSGADVIFDMMPEGKDDFKLLYSAKRRIRDGTRLIKHDLPLIGFLPDKVLQPFYLMRYPFRKAASENKWAESVLNETGATADDVWRELYYYGYEKHYGKREIEDFAWMLRSRMRHSNPSFSIG